VDGVAGAADAFAALDRALPDVIISDIEMPTHDGYQFIRELRTRRREHGGTVPAIALTAYARPEDRARSLIAGFQLHLSKPVDFDELIAAVSTLGGKRRAQFDSARTQ
jgi:CheY-like chemotaxis protein